MPTLDVATVLAFIKFAVDEEPKVAASLKKLFGKADPTTADFDAEIVAVRSMTFENEVPNAGQPPTV